MSLLLFLFMFLLMFLLKFLLHVIDPILRFLFSLLLSFALSVAVMTPERLFELFAHGDAGARTLQQLQALRDSGRRFQVR
jgi:hypothetical protein